MSDTNLSLLINNSEINILSNDISVLFNQLDQMFTALNNLSHINTTLSTYGATESMLVLINGDNSFAKSLGIDIPKLTKANKSSVTASMEAATEEAKKGVIKRIVEWITKIIAKIKEFISKLFFRKEKAKKMAKEIRDLPRQEADKILRESDTTIIGALPMDAEKHGIDTLKKIKSDVDKIYKEVYHTPMLGVVYFSNPDGIKQNIQNVLNDIDELDKYLDEHTVSRTSIVNLKYNYTDLVKISTEITSYPTEERIDRKKSILNVLSTARDLLKLARKDEDIKNLTIEVELFNKYLKLISRELGIAWRLLSTPEHLSRLILPTSGK